MSDAMNGKTVAITGATGGVSFYSALEASLRGVVFKKVCEIFRWNKVVDCNHLDFRAEKTLFNE